jgi:hypothetical protein
MEEPVPRIAPNTRLVRRQSLIDAAWQHTATMCFQDLTVDDARAAAGVSKGVLYGYEMQI